MERVAVCWWEWDWTFRSGERYLWDRKYVVTFCLFIRQHTTIGGKVLSFNTSNLGDEKTKNFQNQYRIFNKQHTWNSSNGI